jgi:hypothetical protein
MKYYQAIFFLILAVAGGVVGFTDAVPDLAFTGKVACGVTLVLALICFLAAKKK